MRTLCTNESCARAGWCKRFTYRKYAGNGEYAFAFFSCSSADNYKYYIRNKAREIYERENPNDAYRDEESESEEHPDNNREPRLRENDEAIRRATEYIQRWGSSEPYRVLQLQRSSYRGSDQQSVDQSLQESESIYRDIRDRIFERIQELSAPAILQDAPRHGISDAGTEQGGITIRPVNPELWEVARTLSELTAERKRIASQNDPRRQDDANNQRGESL